MYYPESDIIASEHSHLLDKIQKVDNFLFNRQGRPFYAGTAADKLQMKLTDLVGILNLYKGVDALSERRVWLCPKHREEIDFVSDEILFCPSCGRNYREQQCKIATLYTAQRIELARDKAHPNFNVNDTDEIIDKPNQFNISRSWSLPRLNEPWAIIIAAIIGVIGAIGAAIIISNANNSGNQTTEPTPNVIFAETSTATVTLSPSSTRDNSEMAVTLTYARATETPFANPP